jgi:hypothetical protein
MVNTLVNVDRARGTVRMKGLASESDYRTLVADRPPKFNAKQVGYEEHASGKHKCHGCFHLYKTFTTPERVVCEVFRPDNDVDVNPEGWCRFWSKDGKSLPDLELEEK